MIGRSFRNGDARIPPGPRGLAVTKFFGNGTFEGTLDFLTQQAREHGPIVMFEVLGRRMYLLDDPELLREVLVTQQHRFARATGAGILREIVGTSLITAEEPLHRTRRRMLQPAFHRKRTAAYGAVMTEEARAVAASIVAGERLDIERAMRTVSQLGPVVEFLPPWADALRRRLPLRSNRELARARAELRAIVAGVVERRRRTYGGEADLLGLVLDARDDAGKGFDDDAVADELSTLLLAGHETTATALTWAWYLLARNPDAEAALHAELNDALGARDPSPGDVPRLRYTGAVFSETLRLYPPASAFGRRALETCRLGGYTIPRGSGIVISPYVSHRNERFFPDAERFSPERFLATGGRETERPEFAFVPFGGGARRCIGDGFARMEAVLALATLARRFRFEAVDALPVGIASATLRPAQPIRLRAVPRAVRIVCDRVG
jgi:cytochrome P450